MQSEIFYSDFGAKGDGITNDFYAIKAAHDKANEIGAKVYANADATYYIGKTGGESITVKTDTYFCGAHFIIDDRDITPEDPERRAPLFILKSDYELKTFDEESDEVKALKAACPINLNTKKLPLAFGFPVLIIPYDSGKKVYIRRGNTPTSGTDQHELIIIDENGNIDENTSALLPYADVTKLEIIRVDDKPITLENGKFTTRANKAPREYTSYARNIRINRSNVTLRKLEHYITDETDTGAPYSGFISFGLMNNLLVEDTVLSGHKTYWETSGRSLMGTYDIGGSNSNGIFFRNCRQANMYCEDGSYNTSIWGIMGTNFCKNITYDTCVLSRLDAHAGVYNATVKNSDVGTIRLTGGGKFLLENSRVRGYGNSLISLREDFGCTWQGDIEIRNTHFLNQKPETYVFGAEFYPYHNFGYQAYYPENIVIDGLSLETPAKLYLFSDVSAGKEWDPEANTYIIDGETKENVNKTILPKNIAVKRFPKNACSFTGSPSAVLNSKLKLDQ